MNDTTLCQEGNTINRLDTNDMDLFFNVLDTELTFLLVVLLVTQVVFWTLFIEWCRFLLTRKVDYSLRLWNRPWFHLVFWLLVGGIGFLWYFADETGYDNTQGILIMGIFTLATLLLLILSFLFHRFLFFILDSLQFKASFRNHIFLLLLLSVVCIGSIIFLFSQAQYVTMKIRDYQEEQYKK